MRTYYPKLVTWETLTRLCLQPCLFEQSSLKIHRKISLCICSASAQDRRACVFRQSDSHKMVSEFPGRLAVSRNFHTSLQPLAASLLMGARVLPIPWGSLLTQNRARAGTCFSVKPSVNRLCRINDTAACLLRWQAGRFLIYPCIGSTLMQMPLFAEHQTVLKALLLVLWKF